MKIIKYTEFIKEEFTDTPESYIEVALKQIKKKIDKMFEFQEVSDFDPSEEEEGDKEIRKAKLDSKKKSDISFKDLGVRLESSEISKYSKLHDSLTIKFSDGQITKNVEIKKIDEDFLIGLKIDMDDKFGDDEEFEIETND